ncbi:MAG: hypothetical protein Hyperionvirus12_30 [Hyperionvirus sp.]|uniref:Uncharacterized protein n=1 Tax=Hyperionvirus sp. TaxID=2487770 RepID=A0A3G5AD60_9VIRU|nr:MAG: hypothetical protein Hyperionvirus12_30 [Hyperionvirus sp.]
MGNLITHEYVHCYNCVSEESKGCLLCRKYGDSKGQLLKKYRFKKIQFFGKDGIAYTFIPPAYVCLQCKDTRKSIYHLWDIVGTDEIPSVILPCHQCCEETHKVEFGKAYFHVSNSLRDSKSA